jgi:hypothetical protein
MGALTIAFDTTIVGALALPWVILVVHLFFFEGENRLGAALNWVKTQQMPAVAGILLFAAAYTLGSAVSRLAQDFFNDDDLYLPVGQRLIRMGVTENRILTSVYCKRDANALLLAGTGNPALKEKICAFERQESNGCSGSDNASPPECKESPAPKEKVSTSRPQKASCLCWQTLSWFVGPGVDWDADDSLNQTAADLFGLQESALLLRGEDATQRLRQIHDQVMVLRGAAFNGLVGFSLCLFAWGVNLRRQRPRSGLRWVLTLVPAPFLIVSIIAATHHFSERSPSDPPYMEFSLLLIGVAGALLLWLPRRRTSAPSGEHNGPHCTWAALSLLSVVLTAAAMLGWWATESAYAQEVIYSYDSQGAIASQK